MKQRERNTAFLLLLLLAAISRSQLFAETVRLRLVITTRLPYANTPLDPEIDFPAWIRRAGADGTLDPNSIEIRSSHNNQLVPHALSEDFAYSDKGRVEFVVVVPSQCEFEIRFRTVPRRPPLRPPTFTPQIGLGDLLRYNAPRPTPITVSFSPGLHDLNGDGTLDLTGTWNYAYRPGWPWDGIVCYPNTAKGALRYGDLTRLRYMRQTTSKPQFFSHTYMAVDFADFNRDGELDLVLTRSGTKSAEFFLNTGHRDIGGMPTYEPGGTVRVNGWQACRAIDLNDDGAIDLVVDGEYVRNLSPDGWPFQANKPIVLNAGRRPTFIDIDRDGRLDSICLQGGESVQPDFYQVAWKRNLGGTPPKFGDAKLIDEIDLPDVTLVSTWSDKERSGLIVQHNAFQQLSVYRADQPIKGSDRQQFRRLGRTESMSAVMSLSDQAWPCLTDWDDDGDQDLLVGGGYGWPRIVVNSGSQRRPAFQEPRRILADRQVIRFVRNQILGKPDSWHDMGYPFPDFVDWDGDGLRDLVCPNETNRIFWYRNVGTRKAPVFAVRQQIVCDGFPDSPAHRQRSATRANDKNSNNGVYPLEEERPFMWRTAAAIADFNGDGLTDLVTHDGHTRVATLFVQYRHEDTTLHLRKDRVLRLGDGVPINDAIVKRGVHWTESFRPVDWDADGLKDLIYSVAGAHHGTKDGGSIYLLRNVGTKTDPTFAAPVAMRCFGQPIRITNHGPHPWPGDFDGDGKPDLITCVEWSVYPYYSYAALMMAKRPEYRLQLR
jgi:hypothetical protein